MFRKAMLVLQIFMIVGSMVWGFSPNLLYANDSTLPEADFDLSSEPVNAIDDTTNDLEYFGTGAGGASPALVVDDGPEPNTEPLNIADDTPETFVASPLLPGGEVGPECLQVRVQAYRPDETPWDPDAGGSPNFPAARLSNYFGNRLGWDWDNGGGGLVLTPRPPGGGQWPGWPNAYDPANQATGPSFTFTGPGEVLPQGLVDARVDPDFNYQAIRGERMIAVIHIRNMTNFWQDPLLIDCNMDNGTSQAINGPISGFAQVGAGDGQPLIFNSMELQINSSLGNHQTIGLTRSDFFHSYDGVSLDTAHQIDMDPTGTTNFLDLGIGEIERSGESALPSGSPRQRERYFNDVIGFAVFDVPFDAVDYLELNATNLNFQCTLTAPRCGTPFANIIDPNPSYYVVPLGGPYLYQDGEVNTIPDAGLPAAGTPHDYSPYDGFNPFVTTHLVGGEGNRSAGEVGWFVVEVKSHLGTGTDPVSVQRVEDVAASLPECNGTLDPGSPSGWYDTLVIDPVLGPVGGSNRLGYAGAAGDADNLQLGANESAYCVFSRVLIPDAGNTFNFQADMLAYGYVGGAFETNELTSPIFVDISFPIAGAEISVDKVITDPLIGNPPEPDRVIPGDTVTYEITITNEGQVDVDNVSFIDSLTGPVTFPGLTLMPGEFVTTQVQHLVSNDDPNPIFNTVNAFAEIAGTNVVLEAFDSASILQQDDLLGISLTARGNVTGSATPELGVDTQVIYTLSYSNNTDVPFTEVYFVDATPGNPYPILQNPGSINVYLPNYPTVEVYSDNPPTGTSVLLIPQPGSLFLPQTTYGPIEWAYDLPIPPPLGQPLSDFPLVQEVVMEGIGESLEIFQGDELLVTDVLNNNLEITAQLWDATLNQPRADQTTVLRDETLTFDLTINHTSGLDRCNVFVRQYIRNPQTGVETLIDPDVQFDWATANILPAASPFAATSTNQLRPTYTVQETSPDPLIMIFEFDAREDCGGGSDLNFIDRVTLTLDVSNILIDTQIQTVIPGTTTQITSAQYPLTGLGNQDFQIVYRAVNNGPTVLDIIDWSWCLVSAPIPGEDCITTPAGGFDVRWRTGLPRLRREQRRRLWRSLTQVHHQ